MRLAVHPLVLHPAGALAALAPVLPALARVAHSLAWVLPSLVGVLSILTWILPSLAWELPPLAGLCGVHPGGRQGLRLDTEAGHPLALAPAVRHLG